MILFYSPFIFCEWAEKILQKMSVREKIGQLLVVPCAAEKQSEELMESILSFPPYRMNKEYIEWLIQDYKIGGIIFLLKTQLREFIDKTNHYQQLSTLPLLHIQDAEWGLSMRLYGPLRFPRNMTLGAIKNEQLLYAYGKEVGRQCRELGIHINCAPVADVNNNVRNPVINDRSFGEDSQAVARKAVLVMQGMQDAGIIACAKHFPGHGDTEIDSHSELPIIRHQKKRLEQVELYPFKELIKGKVGAVMGAHLKVLAFDDTTPSSLSKKIMTDLLKSKMGFKGLVLTDALGMGGLSKHFDSGEIEVRALLAGNDLLVCPMDVPKAVKFIEEAIERGVISQKELDEKVLKILRIKEQFGLHKNRLIDKKKALKNIRSNDARQLKKNLFEQAVTLVKDEQRILPLDKNKEIKVVQIGGPKISTFATQMKKKFVNARINFKHKILTKSVTRSLIREIEDHQPLVVAIFEMSKLATQSFGIDQSVVNLLYELETSHKNLILILFGSPYSLSFFDNQKTILLGYEDDDDAQKAVVDILSGLLQPTASVPVTTN